MQSKIKYTIIFNSFILISNIIFRIQFFQLSKKNVQAGTRDFFPLSWKNWISIITLSTSITELKIIVYICNHCLKRDSITWGLLLTWKIKFYRRSGYLREIYTPVVSPYSSNHKSIDNVSKGFWVRVPVWKFLRLIRKIEFVSLNRLFTFDGDRSILIPSFVRKWTIFFNQCLRYLLWWSLMSQALQRT